MILMMQAMMGAATVPPASDPAFDPSAFVFTIRVENDGDSFTWPHRSSTHGGTGLYDAIFDWGDGSADHFTDTPTAHIYASAGDYDISVIGVCDAPYFTFHPDSDKLVEIKQMGSLAGATNWIGAFFLCNNLARVSATDPFGEGVTMINAMFAACPLLEFTDISQWDVSGVTNARNFLADSSMANPDVSGWDVSSMTNMRGMFENASSFDRDLSGWCVSLIDSEPDGFATGSALQPQHYPVWGTCP